MYSSTLICSTGKFNESVIDIKSSTLTEFSLCSISATTSKPWYNETDTTENNLRAKKAYTALLTIVAKQPVDNEYMRFSQELKTLAHDKYNYTFPPNQTVSTFVTAFYDAVLLYAYALNDSITRDPRTLYGPINGTQLVHLMWDRSFKGITGNVTIDKNGDRISDYSLLDMDPETGYFHIVANYYNSTGLRYVTGKSIHWAGGRTDAPPDKPECGFDNSLCPCKFECGMTISTSSNLINIITMQNCTFHLQRCLDMRFCHLFWA